MAEVKFTGINDSEYVIDYTFDSNGSNIDILNAECDKIIISAISGIEYHGDPISKGIAHSLQIKNMDFSFAASIAKDIAELLNVEIVWKFL